MTLDRPDLTRALLAVYGLSFSLNFVWEMLQMPLFNNMDWSPSAWALCAAASLGDAAFSAATYGALALWHRDAWWLCRRDARDTALVAGAGLVAATLGERIAGTLGWWSYSALMPLVLYLNVGAAPFVQLAALTLATLELLRPLSPCLPRAT